MSGGSPARAGASRHYAGGRNMTEDHDIDASALGPNMWLIDELYRRYREDPTLITQGK